MWTSSTALRDNPWSWLPHVLGRGCPHVNDIELKYIADLLLKINALQYSIKAANAARAQYTSGRKCGSPMGRS
jgi:hypothetical protein